MTMTISELILEQLRKYHASTVGEIHQRVHDHPLVADRRAVGNALTRLRAGGLAASCQDDQGRHMWSITKPGQDAASQEAETDPAPVVNDSLTTQPQRSDTPDDRTPEIYAPAPSPLPPQPETADEAQTLPAAPPKYIARVTAMTLMQPSGHIYDDASTTIKIEQACPTARCA